jgi:hypothetical protein
MSSKETLVPLTQIAAAIARENYGDDRYLVIARDLWEGKFSKQKRLAPLLNGVENDRAYLADLVHAAEVEIQAAIDCLKEDGLITYLDPITHLPTVSEAGAFVSEQQIRNLMFIHHERNKERIKAQILDKRAVEISVEPSGLLWSTEKSQPEGKTVPLVPIDDTIDWPACFPNYGHVALEKAFECGKWRAYTERASRNGLAKARVEGTKRGKYNLYIAAYWWLDYAKPANFDLARLNRKLADNLLPEFKHLKNRLIGELD